MNFIQRYEANQNHTINNNSPTMGSRNATITIKTTTEYKNTLETKASGENLSLSAFIINCTKNVQPYTKLLINRTDILEELYLAERMCYNENFNAAVSHIKSCAEMILEVTSNGIG